MIQHNKLLCLDLCRSIFLSLRHNIFIYISAYPPSHLFVFLSSYSPSSCLFPSMSLYLTIFLSRSLYSSLLSLFLYLSLTHLLSLSLLSLSLFLSLSLSVCVCCVCVCLYLFVFQSFCLSIFCLYVSSPCFFLSILWSLSILSIFLSLCLYSFSVSPSS
jgi:hypothetical protein